MEEIDVLKINGDKLLNIFEKLWSGKCIALNQEEKSQNNSLESHVLNQISGKSEKKKI